MISDEELNEKIEQLAKEYHGQLDDLYAIVGMVVMGRHFGWKVIRLTSRRGHWALANKCFGDVKKLLPERGLYAHRSVGLRIADKLGNFWDIVRGTVSVSQEERKLLE